MTNWTLDQVIALAPDANSVTASREVATAKKWQLLACSTGVLWGELHTGGKPYVTLVDLSVPRFKCSCPSRKFPCKHGLGLLMLYIKEPQKFKNLPVPDFVTDWLTKYAEKQQRVEKPIEQTPKDEAAAAKRQQKREERILTGLEELQRWLEDMLKQGLADLPAQPLQYWERTAARLVDAQAGGLARLVREMPGLVLSGDGWEARLLHQIALLQLLIAGYRRIQSLPPALAAEVRTRIGWQQDQKQLMQADGLEDEWLVMGKRVDEELLGSLEKTSSTIKSEYTWVYGKKAQQFALILQFAVPGQVIASTFLPGKVVSGVLVYFAGAYPQRALFKTQQATSESPNFPSGYANWGQALTAYHEALSGNPWLNSFPMILDAVTPVRWQAGWALRDVHGTLCPINTRFTQESALLAFSGGKPISVFVEYLHGSCLPYSASKDMRWVIF